MFERGEKVVCVNDDFQPIHRTIYRALPRRDVVYTVRDCTLGRTRTGGADKGHSYLVLLVELVNGPDPYMDPSSAEELGFKSDRFAPVIHEEIGAEAEFAESATR
jgi:hypothetical protein